jgi:hypothetical protein
LSRLKRTRKLFAFLRLHRDELFDQSFQTELATMYRQTGAGKAPCPPALLAMAALIQGYMQISDAEAVELTVVDKRWQMVLDRLGQDEPAFAQGTLLDFRSRMIRTHMDRRLLHRTAELARRSRGFDPKKLPKSLRLAVDSAPLEGAGRVEDTINLLWHTARKIVERMAELMQWDKEAVCQAAGIPLLLSSSAKRALDVDWSQKGAQQEALDRLVEQLESLVVWLSVDHRKAMREPLMAEHVETLKQVLNQDLEPDPDPDQDGLRIREGTAADRRISIEDGQMRHGRKSKSHRINGYKRHVATDLDTDVIVACAVTGANRPEQEATPGLEQDLEAQGLSVEELHVDQAYANSSLAQHTLANGRKVICRPRVSRNGELFSKEDFTQDLERMTITCPAGQTQPIQLGKTAKFDAAVCALCLMRPQCTKAAGDRGRTVSIAEDEGVQQERRQQVKTPEGRARLRERVKVEHGLAHTVARQGQKARYKGVRKNLYDLRRTCSIGNLEVMQRPRAAVVPFRAAA